MKLLVIALVSICFAGCSKIDRPDLSAILGEPLSLETTDSISQNRSVIIPISPEEAASLERKYELQWFEPGPLTTYLLVDINMSLGLQSSDIKSVNALVGRPTVLQHSDGTQLEFIAIVELQDGRIFLIAQYSVLT